MANSEEVTESVAAVVVTFNRAEMLRRVLKGIRSQTRVVTKIFVVDNAGGGHGVTTMGREAENVEWLSMTENLGAAGGFAAGMAAALDAGYDWIWLFNDDAIPAPDLLNECLYFAHSPQSEQIGVICPSGTDPATGRGTATAICWRGRPVFVRLSRFHHPLDVDAVTFNGALIGREVLATVGVPRSDYFMMFEEWEFCLRVRAAGFRVVLIPTHSLSDEKAGSTGNMPPWRLYYQTRNHLAMVLERKSPLEVAWWAERQMKLLVAGLLFRDRKRERVRLRALGTLDALRGRMGRVIDPVTYSAQ